MELRGGGGQQLTAYGRNALIKNDDLPEEGDRQGKTDLNFLVFFLPPPSDRDISDTRSTFIRPDNRRYCFRSLFFDLHWGSHCGGLTSTAGSTPVGRQ